MKLATGLLVFCFLLDSCANRTHLLEKVIEGNGRTIRWYRTGDHEFVDFERGDWTYNIMEANTGTVENTVINKDTVIIKATPGPGRTIYSLSAYVQGTYIRLDTSRLRW